jgi:hypothetical protein
MTDIIDAEFAAAKGGRASCCLTIGMPLQDLSLETEQGFAISFDKMEAEISAPLPGKRVDQVSYGSAAYWQTRALAAFTPARRAGSDSSR